MILNYHLMYNTNMYKFLSNDNLILIKLMEVGRLNIKKAFINIIMQFILAMPCLYYIYLRMFNPIIANLTPESLRLRLNEGQKSVNYTIYELRYAVFIIFSVYMVTLISVWIVRKLRQDKFA